LTYIQVKQLLKQEQMFMGNWLDGCGLLLVDLMWVTVCPALTLVNTSSDKRRNIAARGSYYD